jgi:hypothetical protein
MPRTNITRKTVDLTTAQAGVLDRMIALAEERASAAAGLPVTIGTREFFHMLLKRYGEELGLEWPEDYPKPGGWRGGPKDRRSEEE